MLLKDKFYKVINEEKNGTTGKYTVAILPDCNVYDGHFPGDPVCPGVCNIETIKECAMMLTGKDLRIKAIKQCRLTAIATPAVCPEVIITINAAQNADGSYLVIANISDDKQSYMDFKGTLSDEK
jgi:3-hydroxyacyl-[acyl-carrier-protein] dehydratase